MPAARRIVLCLDGTWNNTYREKEREDGSRVAKPSNVLKMYRSVLPRDADGEREQIVYYDPGVGSIADYPGLANAALRTVDNQLGGALGAGFEANIEEALTFLVQNYRRGDQLFVFGFSRGAATARGLSQFLDWSGGLPARHDAYYLPLLFRRYAVSHGSEPAAAVKAGIDREATRELAPFRPVTIDMLGAWDTVMALGIRFRDSKRREPAHDRSFYVQPTPARCVRHAFQALAIDESRYDFRPEVWIAAAEGQTLRQRWFPGSHSNVGGGYVKDGLANGPFHWFLDEAAALGLAVDRRFAGYFRPYARDVLYRSRGIFYRAIEAIRLRSRRGRRRLTGRPESAHLTLDASVIHRLNGDPAEEPRLGGKRYRPKNVLRFLAHQPDLDAHLATIPGLKEKHRKLPADALERIGEIRRKEAP